MKEENLEVSLHYSHFKFLETVIFNLAFIDKNVEYIFHVAAQLGVRTSWRR